MVDFTRVNMIIQWIAPPKKKTLLPTWNHRRAWWLCLELRPQPSQAKWTRPLGETMAVAAMPGRSETQSPAVTWNAINEHCFADDTLIGWSNLLTICQFCPSDIFPYMKKSPPCRWEWLFWAILTVKTHQSCKHLSSPTSLSGRFWLSWTAYEQLAASMSAVVQLGCWVHRGLLV